MAATVRVYAFDGATPTAHTVDTADTASVSFSRGITYNDTATPITIPTAGNRRFSCIRYLALYTTAGGGSTTLSNLKVAIASQPALGIEFFALTGGQTTYTQPNTTQGTAAGNYPADDASATGTVAPTNYTLLATNQTTTYVDPAYYTFDATGGAATNSAKSGKYCQMVMAVTGSYTGGGNASTTVPNIKFQYDEA